MLFMTDIVVGIVMGSDSDLPVMQGAATVLETLQVGFELTIVSAHRTPKRLFDYAQTAEERGLSVIIAGAGGAAHLPGMVASLTCLPVIGVPIKTSALNGQDSLLSIVQMPAGVPVATVAINNAQNAGILAAQIMAIKFPTIRAQIYRYKSELEQMVLAKAEKLEQLGYSQYLADYQLV
jgi:5-(carboxyamino)imidazole ribonucleotide mutase